MLGIAIDGEYLELEPLTKLELQQNNPFLQFDNETVGDFSMPVEFQLTPKNMKLLRFAGLMQTRPSVNGIDCSVFDNDLQHSIGKLKAEQPQHNLLGSNRGKISMFYLTGVANFYQDIKYLGLRKIDLGGDRTFAWDNYNTAGAGFWGHIHSVLAAAPGSYDYAFYPVINLQWTGDNGLGTSLSNTLMNAPDMAGGQVVFHRYSTDYNELNAIVPFPYLKYVLQKAVAAAGWNIDGPILDDPDFKKITMVNFQAIDWGFISKSEWDRIHVIGRLDAPGTHPANITFNLQDCMPDMSVSDFLLSLKNRFGWWYDFDRRTKTIHIRELKQVVSSTVKDFTKQVSPVITKKMSQQLQFYALKNQFVGEYANGAPLLNNLNNLVFYKGPVNHKTDLPVASADLNGNVYLLIEENNFYICRSDAASTADLQIYSWQFYAYNVYDVIPVLPNQMPDDYSVGRVDVPVVPVLTTPQPTVTDITTKATCLGNEQYINQPPADDAGIPNTWLDFLPRMDLAGNWGYFSQNDGWGIHLLMYHGIRNNKLGQPVPFATSGIYDSTGTQVSEWALAFQCKKFDGSDVGLYTTNWKPVLDKLQSAETLQFTLSLTRSEFSQLKFSDTIIIQGVKMYLTQMRPTIPFDGTMYCEALRI